MKNNNENKIVSHQVTQELLNNTKLSRVLSTMNGLIDNGAFRVLTIPKQGIVTTVDLSTDKKITLSNPNVTPFDMAIIDSVCTLQSFGYEAIYPELIARILSGDQKATYISQKRVSEIIESLDKLSMIRIRIDYTEEIKAYRKLRRVDEGYLESYLLPLDKIKIKLASNGKELTGYKLLRTPAIFEYAEKLGQIISVPIELLETQDEIKDTDDVIILKRYIIKRIEQIKHDNDLNSNRISYEWYDKDKRKGLYQDLGYHEEDFSNWREKKRKIHEAIKKILISLQKQDYIKSFQEYKNGKTITGVEIIV